MSSSFAYRRGKFLLRSPEVACCHQGLLDAISCLSDGAGVTLSYSSPFPLPFPSSLLRPFLLPISFPFSPLVPPLNGFRGPETRLIHGRHKDGDTELILRGASARRRPRSSSERPALSGSRARRRDESADGPAEAHPPAGSLRVVVSALLCNLK